MGVRHKLGLALPGAIALLLALPATGLAGTVVINGDRIDFSAAAGQVNTLTVSQSGDTFTVQDTTTPLTPLAGCSPVDANTATCTDPIIGGLFLVLGDMNDTATIADSVTARITTTIYGYAGADTLNGGQFTDDSLGADEVADPADIDTLNGRGGNDRLSAWEGNDVLDGGPGDDSLEPGPGNDTAVGGPGRDIFDSSFAIDGSDSFNGGPGFDQFSYRERLQAVTITSADDLANDGAVGENDNVGVGGEPEELRGGAGNDTIVAGGAFNEIEGNEGDDELRGGGGSDTVSGGEGADTVFGGAGDDSLGAGFDSVTDTLDAGPGDDVLNPSNDEATDLYSGGAGTDLIDFTDERLPVIVRLDNIANDGLAGLTPDNFRSDIEDVLGGDGRDLLIGSGAANELSGGPGRDLIRGLGGADGLTGNAGRDRIVGGPGRDSIFGNGGADSIVTRDKGADEIECGGGVDQVRGDRRDSPQPDCEKVSLPRRGGGGA
jgi:Ca2+-binding RTX toxin-like protein